MIRWRIQQLVNARKNEQADIADTLSHGRTTVRNWNHATV